MSTDKNNQLKGNEHIEVKKSAKVNLEQHKTVWLLIGFIMVFLIKSAENCFFLINVIPNVCPLGLSLEFQTVFFDNLLNLDSIVYAAAKLFFNEENRIDL